jgi:Dimethyladenosine transferase (rRNA methylation)
VLLQAWYDIEYLFSVGSGCFAPPPKVESAVIRLTRNSRTSLGCDESLFKAVVKTAFGQRRKTLRNSLKPIIMEKAERCGWDTSEFMGASSDAGADAPELELMLLEDDGRINRKKGKKAPRQSEGSLSLSKGLSKGSSKGAPESTGICTTAATSLAAFLSDPVFERRPETLSVEDFIALTNFLA